MECLAWLKAAGALHVAKVGSMIAITIIVLVSNGQRPKVPYIYHTNDPHETERNGASYVCGCSLPTNLETPQAPKDPPNSSWNVCYDRSSLNTTTVLVYPNFTGVHSLEWKLLTGRPDFWEVKHSTVVDGCLHTTQAHDLDWGDDRARFEKYANLQSISDLYGGGYIQSELFPDVRDLEKLLDFPAPYLATTFSFRCSNCSSCDLDSVTSIFQGISGQPWGECTYWGQGNECALINRYHAKCSMYPTARVPLEFGIQSFFKEFKKLPDIYYIRPLRYPDRVNSTSFVSNELFMNLRSLVPTKVKLSFVEIQKGSSAWVSLLDYYPTLRRSCLGSSVQNQSTTLSGTSFFNLHRSESNGYGVNCTLMTDERLCREMHANMTINNVPTSTWNDFHVKPNDWQRLMCPPYIADNRPSYLVVSRTAPAVQGSLLNDLLESKFLLSNWRLDSGVCTQTYSDIISYTWQDEITKRKDTLFMETECSEAPHSDGYCWLTGRYRNLTDIPGTAWQNMSENSTAEDRFVCYNVAKQGVVKWFIFLVGILFSWLGTIDLVFKWIARFCCKPRPGAKQSFDATADAPNQEENTGKDAGGTSADLEAVSGRTIDPRANLETDFRPSMGLEMDVTSEPNLHSGGGGPSGPIAELAKKLSRTRTYSKIREN